MPRKKKEEEEQTTIEKIISEDTDAPKEEVDLQALGLDEIEAVKENVFQQEETKESGRATVKYNETREERMRRLDRIAIAISAAKDAKRHGTICKGFVSGADVKTLNGESVVCLEIPMDGDVKAIIPLPEFFQDFGDHIRLETVETETTEGKKDYITRQLQIANKLFGLDARFIITDIYEDNDITLCVASRKKALEIERWAYWLRPNANIKENNIYPAKIVSISAKSAYISLGGYERRIGIKKFTNQPCHNDLRTLFNVGDSVPVYVRRIEISYDVNGKPVSVEPILDLITGELYKFRDNLDKLQVPLRGDTAQQDNEFTKGKDAVCTITKIIPAEETRDENAKFIGWVEGYNVPIKLNSVPFNRMSRPYERDDRVSITITGKLNSGYAVGFVRHFCGYTR